MKIQLDVLLLCIVFFIVVCGYTNLPRAGKIKYCRFSFFPSDVYLNSQVQQIFWLSVCLFQSVVVADLLLVSDICA